MGFKKFLGEVAGGIKGAYDDYRERKEGERELDEERQKQLEKERDDIDKLLDKFEFPDLEKLCKTYLGNLPEGQIEEDDETGKQRQIKPNRRDFLDFIWDNLKDGEIKYLQIKDFALKNRIVSPSFFGFETSQQENKRDFENLINTIRAQFEPERITNEEHLQSQLAIFLKAKYPDRKVTREVPTKYGDFIDIVVDDKFAFELKVPEQRAVLRNLGSQLEEYVEQYPMTCAVIFDNQELNLSEIINEYADRYKRNYSIPTIIIRGEKRTSNL